MARTIRDASLDTRTARSRLQPSGKPYYRSLEHGLHLGYRKPRSGTGKWVARHYLGNQTYEVEVIAAADDYSDADGIEILDYRQAQQKARERREARARSNAGKDAGPLTVRAAMEWLVHSIRRSLDTSLNRRIVVLLQQLGDAMAKGRIMRSFSISEVSCVDRPAARGGAGDDH